MVKLLVYAFVIFLVIFGPFILASDRHSQVGFGLGAVICWGGPAALWLLLRWARGQKSTSSPR
jgi:hypothetical protein